MVFVKKNIALQISQKIEEKTLKLMLFTFLLLIFETKQEDFLNKIENVSQYLQKIDQYHNFLIQMQEGQFPKLTEIDHFGVRIPMTPETTFNSYKPHHTTNKLKKNKRKLDEFTYYRIDGDKIIKVLFKDDENYQLQGAYPFTDPEARMETKTELNKLNPKRVIKVQAAYIGHFDDKVAVKKLDSIKLGGEGSEFQTNDDNFQVLPIGNVQRFTQFMKILAPKAKAAHMSMRVIIDESTPTAPKVIDYQFFKREEQIKNTNKIFNKKQ